MRRSAIVLALALALALVPSLAAAQPAWPPQPPQPPLPPAEARYDIEVDVTAGAGTGLGVGMLSVIGGARLGPLWVRFGGGLGFAVGNGGATGLLEGLGGLAVRHCAPGRQMCVEAGVDVAAIGNGSAWDPELVPRVAGHFGGRHASFRIQLGVANIFDQQQTYAVVEGTIGFGYAW